MPTLDWQVAATSETTLVELFVTSDTETRVEISSNLEPIWPPRRQGRPAAGWDGSRFEGVVSAGEPLVLGYASPDDPVEPPATIVDTEPVTESSGGAPTPEALVRELGEAGPPRDAVPAHGSPSTDRDTGADSRSPGHGQTTDEQRPAGHGSAVDNGQSFARESPAQSRETGGPGARRLQTPDGEAGTRGGGPTDSSGTQRSQQSKRHGAGDRQLVDGGTGPESPTGCTRQTDNTGHTRTDRSTAGSGTDTGEAIDTWLDSLGDRIETAERLAAVETAEEARAAVDAVGGIEQVRALCEQLDTDRRRLERIEQRHAGLGDRLDGIDVPLSALERLA